MEAMSKKSNKEKKELEKETKQDSERDEFLKIMKPRTKKGPSWANEDPQGPGKDGMVETAEGPTEGISDLDWLKKHTSKNVDNADKVFEQSGDEDEEVRSPTFQFIGSLLSARKRLPSPNLQRIQQRKRYCKHHVYSCGTWRLHAQNLISWTCSSRLVKFLRLVNLHVLTRARTRNPA